MKTRYFLSIPKPCHENWSEMTPNEKGRFCNSCTKTVVDFTKMNSKEIQSYIHNNKHQRICGHIKQNQLDSINLQISEAVFHNQMNFHKLFVLALLLAMGTTLFSCSDQKGSTKKIESVEIVTDNIDLNKFENNTKEESSKTNCNSSIDTNVSKTKDSLTNQTVVTTGEIIDIVGIMVPERKSTDPYHIYEVEIMPSFKGTPENLNNKELKKLFQTKISNHCIDNFNQEILKELNLTGRQKIYTQFTIDSTGTITNIKCRASHVLLENEAKRVINLLPKFIPAKNGNEKVNVIYNLPMQIELKD